MIDDQETATDDAYLYGGRVLFGGPTAFSTLVRRGGELGRLDGQITD